MSDSKKAAHLKFVAWTMVCGAILYGCYISYVALFYRPFDSNILWVDNMLSKKLEMASNLPSPKLVLAGGSATLFGLSARQMEQALGIPTINLATSAGLGVDYTLERTKEILRPGDIVLYPAEISVLLDEKHGYAFFINFILGKDRRYVQFLPLLERLRVYAAVSCWSIGNDFLNADCQPHQESEAVGVYHSRAINEHGDQTMNSSPVPSAIANLQPFTFTSTLPTYNMTQVVQFAQWCKYHRIRFILGFSNTLDFPQYHGDSNFEAYSRRMLQYFASRQVEVLGTPTDALMPRQYFFDTIYHLTQEGVQLRTQRMLPALAAQLGRRLTGDSTASATSGP